jgi:chorismate mutase
VNHEDAKKILADCRERIDAVDLEILALVNQRARIVFEIGLVKQEYAMPIYEPKREDEVFQNVIGHNSGPLSAEAVRRFFERIIDEMREVQRAQMEKRS